MKARRLAKISPVTWSAYLTCSLSLGMEPTKGRPNAAANASARPASGFKPLSKASSANRNAVAIDNPRKKFREAGRSMDNAANSPRVIVRAAK